MSSHATSLQQCQMLAVPRSKIKLGNSHVSAEPLAGCLYGTLFTLSADGKELVRAEQ